MQNIQELDPFRKPESGGVVPHVLVVEDDVSLQDGLCALIRSEGFTADGAADGLAALAAMARRRPDIVVLDLVLPRMDGYQFMEALVQRHGRGRPKVVVMSAAERLDLARARMDAEAYIAKPADGERLRAALKRLALGVRRTAH